MTQPDDSNQEMIEDGPRSIIKDCLEKMVAHDTHWKQTADEIYESTLQLTDPLFIRINHLRQAFRYFLIPGLKAVLKKSADEQKTFIRHLPFLFDDTLMAQFLSHFYAVKKNEVNIWEFEERDPFRKDVLMLYDLYKAKRTINGIVEFLKILEKRRDVFPSTFEKKKQIEILKGFNSALFMTFKISVKPEYQVKLFKDIGLRYVRDEEIEVRKAKGLLYGHPIGLESDPYRRIFLHLSFRNTIKTVINNKQTTINFSLINFEHLVGEYLGFYLKDDKEDLDATRVHNYFHINGKTFANSIIDDPDPEQIVYEELDELKLYI